MKLEELNAEIDRIEKFGYEQQGYEGARLLCLLTGVSVEIFRDSILEGLNTEGGDALRDKGALRWCDEQLENQ